MNLRPNLQKLLRYNVDVIEQGLQLIDLYRADGRDEFGCYCGPHLRHIVEHYDAFTLHIHTSSVDYDTRARDHALESDPLLARQRLRHVQQQLLALDVGRIAEPIAVQMRGGLGGEDNYVSFSSLSRELLFLASHAIHHYALVRVRCEASGMQLDEHFGKAPATVRHARGA